MYKCKDCNKTFETPKEYSEDLTPGGAFEGGNFIKTWYGCPLCSGDYEELEEENE